MCLTGLLGVTPPLRLLGGIALLISHPALRIFRNNFTHLSNLSGRDHGFYAAEHMMPCVGISDHHLSLTFACQPCQFFRLLDSYRKRFVADDMDAVL